MKNKVILFGGTFDPIHYGHLRVAEYACKHIGADEVVLVPARCSPHKQSLPKADGSARIEMMSLAIAGKKKFRVSDCELKRPVPSYTLDTIRHFRVEYGEDVEIYWLVGADTIKDLPDWYGIGELLEECNLCVMFRAGFERPDFSCLEAILGSQALARLRQNIIPAPLIDINSTEIRRKLATGGDVSCMLAPKVLAYIQKNGLYRP
ncbi:MAG: nicotinate (nicotinamide) nucleotide adenylyltransferase [Planctomycetota bacterium]|jgi:nicotinate-nucleotide adenylyltransferase